MKKIRRVGRSFFFVFFLFFFGRCPSIVRRFVIKLQVETVAEKHTAHRRSSITTIETDKKATDAVIAETTAKV